MLLKESSTLEGKYHVLDYGHPVSFSSVYMLYVVCLVSIVRLIGVRFLGFFLLLLG